MKKIILIALAVIIGISSANAQQNNTIETSVNVKKEATPDEIFISVTINEKDNIQSRKRPNKGRAYNKRPPRLSDC